MNKEYPRKIKIIIILLYYSLNNKGIAPELTRYPNENDVNRLLNTHIYNPDTFEPVKFVPNYKHILKKFKRNGWGY